MAIINLPYTFTAGATIIASQHNSNFNTVYNLVNGAIDTTNISPTAGILYSQLSLGGNITNADINAAAAIAGSKIASIAVTQLTGQLTPQQLANGTATNGLVIISNGTNTTPSWGIVKAPALLLVSGTTFSSASTSGSFAINGTTLYVVKIQISAVSGALIPWLQFNGDANSHYGYTGSTGLTSATKIALTLAATTNPVTGRLPCNITLNIYPQGTSTEDAVFVDWTYGGPDSAGSNVIGGAAAGGWTGSATVTSFAILPSTGTFSGSVYIYSYALS